MAAIASQITSLTIIYSTVYSGADQRKHQSSAPLAFVRGIHRWRGNVSIFDDVIMMKTNPLVSIGIRLFENNIIQSPHETVRCNSIYS